MSSGRSKAQRAFQQRKREQYHVYRYGQRPTSRDANESQRRIFQVGASVTHTSEHSWDVPPRQLLTPGGKLSTLSQRAPRVPAIRSAVNATRTENVTVYVVGTLAETPVPYDPKDYPPGGEAYLGKRKEKASVLRTLAKTADSQNEMLRAMEDLLGFKWQHIDTIYISETI